MKGIKMSDTKVELKETKTKVLHKNPPLTRKQIRQRTKELQTLDLLEETNKVMTLVNKSLIDASDEVHFTKGDILLTVSRMFLSANDKKNKELIRLRRNLIRERTRREFSVHSLSEKLRSKAAEVRILREKVKALKEEIKTPNLEEISTS